MEYQRLFEALKTHDVRYLICGGLAVNIYGIPRMTADIDLILEFEKGNVKRFLNVLSAQDYRKSIPVSLLEFIDKSNRQDFISSKNMVAYSFFNSRVGHMNVDILIDFPGSFSELWERKEVRQINGIDLYLLDLQDLIQLKSNTGRQQDLEDVKLLSKIRDENKRL